MVSTTDLVFLSILGVMGAISIYIAWRRRNKQDISPVKSTIQPTPQSSSIASFTGQRPSEVLTGDVGGTGVFNKITLNINVVTIAMVLAAFAFVMLALVIKEMAIVTMIIGSALFFPIGMFMGAIMIGPARVWLMRRITGRNYGMIKFIHSNKLVKPVIANLDKDIIRFAGGVYYLDKQSIKREGIDAVSDGIIEESKIKFEQGIPTIYFDITDVVPVDFEPTVRRRGTDEEEESFRLPTQVSATLNKEIAVEKAKIMKSFRQQQSMILIILLAIVVINLYFTYTMYSNWEPMKAALDALNQRLAVMVS